jgi:hypothetical protein
MNPEEKLKKLFDQYFRGTHPELYDLGAVDVTFEDFSGSYRAKINIDFYKLIEDKIKVLAIKEIVDDFFDYFNVLRFGRYLVLFSNKDEWVKQVLNKKIKPLIRELDVEKRLHAIQFLPDTYSQGENEMKLIFKNDYSPFGWRDKYRYSKNLIKQVKELIEDLGYVDIRVTW